MSDPLSWMHGRRSTVNSDSSPKAPESKVEAAPATATPLDSAGSSNGGENNALPVVSLFATVKAVSSLPVSIGTVLEGIRVGRWATKVEEVRTTLAKAGKRAADEVKKTLPAVTFSGVFSGGHRADQLASHSGVLCLDFDGLNGNLSDVRSKLAGDPLCFALFTSPSGAGLKLLMKIPADAAEHGRTFDEAAAHFLERYGVTADKSCRDTSRFCFMSYDPDLYHNPGAKEFSPPPPPKPVPPWEKAEKPATTPSPRPAAAPGATPITERASLYLRECSPAVQGQGGHDALLWAARAMVVGFELDQGTAARLLWDEFNPRCIPPWDRTKTGDVKDFERKVAEAHRTPGQKPKGWLLDELGLRGQSEAMTDYGRTLASGLLAGVSMSEAAAGDDLPEILRRKTKRVEVRELEGEDGEPDDAKDPGQTPNRLLRIPGFVSEVMDWTLKTAPTPNVPLAFAGALALQALLAGRKVRDPGDIRTNLYIVALSPSGSGKDHPRKVNRSIAFKCGFSDALGDRFASSEGIEDALTRMPVKLYQTDEMDSLLQSIAAKSGDPRLEGIQSALLTLFGEANSFRLRRDKAGDVASGSISQPHVVLYGTAIPVFFYGALSTRMLTNGVLSRMIIIDSDGQRCDQDAGILDNPPEHIVEVARFWWEFAPGGDLGFVNPVPLEVQHTPSALKILNALRSDASREWKQAEKDDETTRAVWSRVNEMGRKLALVYAASCNHTNPVIDQAAALWGSEFAQHQARRMLAMAGRHGASSQFEKECRAILDKVNAAPGHRLARSCLLKKFKNLSAKLFDERTRTLIERGEIEVDSVSTGGRSGTYYVGKGTKGRK
jgi:hypothetical protein